MSNSYWIALALAAGVGLVLAVSLVRFLRLYAQARIAGAAVTLPELVGAKLYGVDPAMLAASLVMTAREGVPVTAADLRNLALAGGDVPRVVNAMIIARRGGVELPWVRACAIELAGWDVLAAARGAPQSEVETRRDTRDRHTRPA